MSRRTQAPNLRSEVDGPVVTDWRVVYAAAGLAGFCLTGIAGTLILMGAMRDSVEPAAQPVVESGPKRALLPVAEARREAELVSTPAEIVPPAPVKSSKQPPAKKVRPPKPAPVVVAEATPPPVVTAPEPPPPLALDSTSSADLIAALRDVPEIGLDTVKGSAAELFAQQKKTSAKRDEPLEALLKKRPDLRGLPVRMGDACVSGKEHAQELGATAERVHTSLLKEFRLRNRAANTFDVLHERAQAIAQVAGSRMRSREAIPALEQVLQIEHDEWRLALTGILSTIDGEEASLALARRAIFDPSAQVRDEAVRCLRDRPRREYRAVLVQALQHPWLPAAAHAAEALMAVGDREALPALAATLSALKSSQPTERTDGKWEVPQLVRVNHLRNCLLCHCASFSEHDPVRDAIPKPGKELPLPYCAGPDSDFVRADVVYLRPEFSLRQPVEKAKPWPNEQRFDYLIRRTVVTKEEAEAWMKQRVHADGQRLSYVTAAVTYLTQLDMVRRQTDARRLIDFRRPLP